MSKVVKSFNAVLPVELTQSEDGEWKFRSLASTPTLDRQGEVILQEGIDVSPIEQGRGIVNWDHQKGPDNTLGVLDGYKKTPQGLVLEGRLFKNHPKAKAAYGIMSSLKKTDLGRMGMSVEGKIVERDGENGKVIKRCQINGVALTMNPVNQDSYVDLVKSLSGAEIEMNATEDTIQGQKLEEKPVFTTTQVMELIEKALSVSGDYASKPAADLSGGDAVAQEELDKKPKKQEVEAKKIEDKPEKKLKLKKMSKDMYKAQIGEVLDSIQKLYPDYSRSLIWKAVKDRLTTKFPDVNEL